MQKQFETQFLELNFITYPLFLKDVDFDKMNAFKIFVSKQSNIE